MLILICFCIECLLQYKIGRIIQVCMTSFSLKEEEKEKMHAFLTCFFIFVKDHCTAKVYFSFRYKNKKTKFVWSNADYYVYYMRLTNEHF